MSEERLDTNKKRKIDDAAPEDDARAKLLKTDITLQSNEADTTEDTTHNNNPTATKSKEVLTGGNKLEVGRESNDNEIQPESAKNLSDHEEIENKKMKKKENTPKIGFVFGSTTPFGNMNSFKMFGADRVLSFTKKNGEEHEKTVTVDNKEKAVETKPEKEKQSISKPIFGMGSTFGNAFQAAITKKSVFDDMKPKTSESIKDDETSDDTTAKDVYKKVDLEKQEVKSGEENEENLFQIKAKVYQMELSASKVGWKERGFGIIKINKFKEPVSDLYTSRIIMRQNGNLKLILNVPIAKGFKVLKGIPSSLSADKFIRFQIIECDKPVQYAVKVGQAESAEKLFDIIEKQVPQ